MFLANQEREGTADSHTDVFINFQKSFCYELSPMLCCIDQDGSGGRGWRREMRGKERKGTGRKGMERGRDRRREGERDGGRESLIPRSYC